jgi:hypothetical protein
MDTIINLLFVILLAWGVFSLWPSGDSMSRESDQFNAIAGEHISKEEED